MLPILERSLTALLERAVVLAKQDAELRICIRDLAQAVLAATELQEPAFDKQPSGENIAVKVESALENLDAAVSREAATEPPVPSGPLPELTLGKTRPGEGIAPEYPVSMAAPPDLGVIESRCRLKAEGARWAAQRLRLIAEGGSDELHHWKAGGDTVVRWVQAQARPSPQDHKLAGNG